MIPDSEPDAEEQALDEIVKRLERCFEDHVVRGEKIGDSYFNGSDDMRPLLASYSALRQSVASAREKGREEGLREAEELRGKVAMMQKAFAWVSEAHPDSAAYGSSRVNIGPNGDAVHLTWEEWNETRAALGLPPQKPLRRRARAALRGSQQPAQTVFKTEDGQFDVKGFGPSPPHRDPAEEIVRLKVAASALIADVRRRHPGEELTCPFMRALDDALAGSSPASTNGELIGS